MPADLTRPLDQLPDPLPIPTPQPRGAARRALARDGALWICWIKKSSPLYAGFGDAGVRALGLEVGLVDVKVCAVDDDWSGLKFVYRLEDR